MRVSTAASQDHFRVPLRAHIAAATTAAAGAGAAGGSGITFGIPGPGRAWSHGEVPRRSLRGVLGVGFHKPSRQGQRLQGLGHRRGAHGLERGDLASLSQALCNEGSNLPHIRGLGHVHGQLPLALPRLRRAGASGRRRLHPGVEPRLDEFLAGRAYPIGDLLHGHHQLFVWPLTGQVVACNGDSTYCSIRSLWTHRNDIGNAARRSA
mmetsp:Transcript_52896/g.149989  ORF Transcript_52896/g.149989 Transcript_52896/m.149989 type:complete len:208 (+) Transcript_52896:81-704(+)